MKLLNLKLRGSIGVKKGLGLDQIEIDFKNFQPGLVAITGKNGSSKTTILENCQPFRCMVSREGSLTSHFFLKDSYRILEFEKDDKIFEAKILIDALTNNSEAYLLCNGTPLNDGKLTTFDNEIEKVLGSQELFFNSVFSSQKSRGISELKPADRRKLFYELLNLDVYETYLSHAKDELKKVETKLAETEGEIKALAADQTSVDILEDERKTLLEEQAGIISRITDLEIEKDNLNKAIQEIKVKLQLAQDRQKQQKEIESKIFSLTQNADQFTREYNTKVIRYNSEIDDNNKLIARNKKLLDNSAMIEGKINEKKDLQLNLDKEKETGNVLQKEFSDFQKDYSNKLKALGEREKETHAIRISHTNLITDLKQLRQQISKVEAETSLISEVPCDEQTGSSCKFLINAYEGKKSLENLSSRKDALEAEALKSENILHDAEAQLRADKQMIDEKYQLDNSSLSYKISNVKQRILELNIKLDEINKGNYEKLQEEAKKADNEIKMLEQSISGTEKLLTELKNSLEENTKRVETEIAELKGKIYHEIGVRINELNAELASFEKDFALNKESASVLAKDLDKSNAEVTSIEAQIQQIKKNEARIKKLNDDKSVVENEIRDWTFLCKAFDKTGIPVLKLENSGIEITTIANELLSIFENKFRIVFETTKLKADKKSYKESFDINIVDEDGVCELSLKSGGEKVWVESALRLAISLVVRQQGKNIQTAFLDEADGALSLEFAYLYLEMLKNAHKKSGVHNTFIITHRTELLDLIPQQISLSDGYLNIINN